MKLYDSNDPVIRVHAFDDKATKFTACGVRANRGEEVPRYERAACVTCLRLLGMSEDTVRLAVARDAANARADKAEREAAAAWTARDGWMRDVVGVRSELVVAWRERDEAREEIAARRCCCETMGHLNESLVAIEHALDAAGIPSGEDTDTPARVRAAIAQRDEARAALREAIAMLKRANGCPTPGACTCRRDINALVLRLEPQAAGPRDEEG